MHQFMRSQEDAIRKTSLLAPPDALPPLVLYLEKQIQFLQHERLVHLLITLFFAFFCLSALTLYCFLPLLWIALLVCILFILEAFYILHYYRLENGVQRLYLLYNELYAKSSPVPFSFDSK